MTTKHTPGPWSVAETRHKYDTVIRGTKGEPIAIALIAGYTKQEGAANTVLLAAAPDLLEALKVMVRDYAAAHASIGDLEMSPALLQAQRAIARATGEQP